MKRMAYFAAALLTAASCAQATDLVAWPSEKPQTLASLKAPVRVVNLWATWCVPCRKEMPAMSAWYAKQKKGSVDMIGIAMDSSDNMAKFLKTTTVKYSLWRYAGDNSRAWMKGMGNTVGALPFTKVEAPKCGYSETLLGGVDEAKLTASVRKAHMACH